MNYSLLITALEHYYTEEVYREYDRGKTGIETSFKILRNCVEVQHNIIELKKIIGRDCSTNEKELEKLECYWNEDVMTPKELLEKVIEFCEEKLYWYPRELQTAKENGWSTERLEMLIEKYTKRLEEVKNYKESDIELITGQNPFI